MRNVLNIGNLAVELENEGSMNNQDIFQIVIERLKSEPFLNGFKFRKRDSSFIQQESGLRRSIELEHWIKDGVLIIYPIYMARFDVLLKWFEPYSFKSLQDQRDNPSVVFSGNMPERQDKFQVTEDSLEQDYTTLRGVLAECSGMVFSSYTSLHDMYNRLIIPILECNRTLPDVGADWAFMYLTLTRIVSPENYSAVKGLVLSQVNKMAERNEPNIIEYMPRLDEIINAMESQF